MRIGSVAERIATTRWRTEFTRSWIVLLWHWIAVAIGFGLLFVNVILTKIVLRHVVLPPAVLIAYLVVGAGYVGYALSRRTPQIGGFAFFAGALLFIMTFFGAFAATQSDKWERAGILLIAISLSLMLLGAMSASRWLLGDRPSQLADVSPSPLVLREQRNSSRLSVPLRPVRLARPTTNLRFVLHALVVLLCHWMVMLLQLIVLFGINSAALYFWHHHVPYAEYYFAAVQGVTAFFTGCYLRRRYWRADDPAFAAGALLFIVSFATAVLTVSSNHHMEPEAFISLFDVPILMQLGLRTTWRLA